MTHKSSLYRVCGPAIVLGGLLLLTAFALKPPQPASLDAAADLRIDKWVLTNWMFVVGAVALLGGWLGLTQHVNQAVGEGWSTVGLGAVIIGAVGMALAAAINAESLPRLLEAYTTSGGALATSAYFTVEVVTSVLGWMSWTILWIGLALTGLAIAEDAEYPSILGYTGLVIAMLEIASQMVPAESILHDAFGIVGCLWIVAVGVIFTRIEADAPARLARREALLVP